jgi:RNA polymerase sigma-54 factor
VHRSSPARISGQGRAVHQADDAQGRGRADGDAPSTISRVVNRKWAHTPQGVIELRRFFTEGMTNEDGEEVSTRIIKLKIKKLIEEEDPHNPITDDQVVKILMKDGMKLSRRTVAKYRDQMQIPGSRERKAPV